MSKKAVDEKVSKTLKEAQSDPTIFKGLLQYLNWQDSMPNRLETPRVEPVPRPQQVEKPTKKEDQALKKAGQPKPQADIKTKTDPHTNVTYAFETDFGTSSAK